jgi:hypothetical protein
MSKPSQLFPVGQGHYFVQNFLQSLKASLVIPCCVGFVLAGLQVQSVRFTDLRYFISQLDDPLFDRIRHEDRLAPPTGWITSQGSFFNH